jgi:hypothetical protein
VQYTQFILFANPDLNPRLPKEPEYLILQQFQVFSQDPNADTEPIENNVIKPLAQNISNDILTVPTQRTADSSVISQLPDPNDPRIDKNKLRMIALEYKIPGYQPNTTDAELLHVYKDWFTDLVHDRLLDTFEPLERAGFDFDEEFIQDSKDLTSITGNIIKKVILPAPYQPFKNPYPHFAVCATFEQTWEPKGYTRGELINTISLAPGEQLTLEIHSWDKSTIKSEEELATESQMQVTENLTERDVRNVTRNVTTHFEVGGTINLKVGSINPSGNFNTNLTQTLDQTRERTLQASNTLKNSRKLRIEISREVGREQKQTHVIANTNRCHTLNCHYFEVMTNYMVTTNLKSVQLCLLLPNPGFKVSPAWVLCHEDVLMQALLDKTYLPGFKAARTLETQAAFLDVKKEMAKANGDIPDSLHDELQRHVDAIIGAYHDLTNPVKTVKKVAGSSDAKIAKHYGGHLAWAAYVVAKCGVKVLRRMLYWAMLQLNTPAVNALAKLENEKTQPGEALRNFFSAVTPRDYQYNVVDASIANGLDALGLPKGLVSALLQWGLLNTVDYAADDAGLYNAVSAASSKMETVLEIPPATEPGIVQDGLSTMEVAQAHVDFGQLGCHIEDNWVHYLQAIWLRENSDQRFLRIQDYGMISAILDNNVLGFLGHKAAYPITNLGVVKPWVDFEEIKNSISIPPGEPQLVTLPTQGTVLEAIVGECDGCEDYIHESRAIDLRVQDAKAKQEESEANRYQKRVEDADYSDPKVLSAGKVIISIDGNQSQPTG